MSRVVAVVNQKGGVGKTTTTVQLASGLSIYGQKVMVIDMDPQCNATYILGVNQADHNILEVIEGNIGAEEAIIRCRNVDLIASTIYMSAIEQHLPEYGREYQLRKSIENIRDKYDYIIIDCSPSLGIGTVNALTAADEVLIPAMADILSLQGIGQLYTAIESIKEYCNPDLKVPGILLTRQNDRLIHSKQMRELMEETAKSIGTKVFMTSIRDGVAVREASTARDNIFEYAPKSKIAADYMGFVDEYMHIVAEKEHKDNLGEAPRNEANREKEKSIEESNQVGSNGEI